MQAFGKNLHAHPCDTLVREGVEGGLDPDFAVKLGTGVFSIRRSIDGLRTIRYRTESDKAR
jgi:hypothetical protein